MSLRSSHIQAISLSALKKWTRWSLDIKGALPGRMAPNVKQIFAHCWNGVLKELHGFGICGLLLMV